MPALSVTPGRFSSCSSNGPHPSPASPPPPHPVLDHTIGGGGGWERQTPDHICVVVLCASSFVCALIACALSVSLSLSLFLSLFQSFFICLSLSASAIMAMLASQSTCRTTLCKSKNELSRRPGTPESTAHAWTTAFACAGGRSTKCDELASLANLVHQSCC